MKKINLFMLGILLTMAAAAQIITTDSYIGIQPTYAGLMPCANVQPGTLAYPIDTGLVYCANTGVWTNTTGFLPSASIVMPTSAVLLGCGTAQTVAIPTATNFTIVPNANPGNVNVQYWLTGSGTSGATANLAYCTAVVSVTPAAVTYTIKPFSR